MGELMRKKIVMAIAAKDGKPGQHCHLHFRNPSFGVSLRKSGDDEIGSLTLIIGCAPLDIGQQTYNGAYIEAPLAFLDDAIAQLRHAREAVVREMNTPR